MKENTNIKAVKPQTAKTKKVIKLTTKKSIFLRSALLQFFGLVIIAATIIVAIVMFTKNQKTETKTVTVEKIVEVEKPVEITKEVPVEKIIEVEKVVEVIDEQQINAQAETLFNEFKTLYIAQADAELTAEQAELMFNEFKANYVAQADNAEVERLAAEKAEAMFAEFKANYATEQAAILADTITTISIYVYQYNNAGNNFYLQIEGSMYTRLTYDMIKEALYARPEMEGFKIRKIDNKNAVELFIDEDYTSTRRIEIEYK